MALWSRLANVFRGDRLNREIEEEMESHIAEGIARGRSEAEARRAMGPVLHHRERSRDVRIVPWVESLYADAVFGWRQLMKRKAVSAAAVLSLGLAIGACGAAFRLMDAMVWRPLPVAGAERLYVLSREARGPDGKLATGDLFAYPMFRDMRALVKNEAELIAVSVANRIDVTYGREEETEKAYEQYVSGWMFGAFGIRPELGRLFTERDDMTPGAFPYAVLSHEYWMRRFGGDRSVIGKTFRTGAEEYRIVGVAEGPFTGTEPGRLTDIFVPTMMMKFNAIRRADYRWFRTFVQLKPGVKLEPVREKLRASFQGFLEESVKMFAGIPKRERDGYLSQRLQVNAAAAGVSGLQKAYGTALAVLGALVGLVLLIACANVANLMTAQAAARGREMALRVSIGAGRGRLAQLALVECAWIALLAAGLGAVFAWWAAPAVLGQMSTPEYPVQLALPADWRVLGFGVALSLGVTILFGLAPALRAAGVKPASVLRGGDPHLRPMLMQISIAAQAAFCVLVVFVAGLFVTTSERLTHQPTGFSAERLLNLEAVTARAEPAVLWEQVADQLRAAPGVEQVALCEWPLMTGGSWNGFISVNGASPGPVASYFLSVSPGWRELMKIPLLEGRDLRESDSGPRPALVNVSFARQFFGAESVVGKTFETVQNEGTRVPYRVAGLVGDARYKDLREPIQPTAYFALRGDYGRATFVVRTASANPLAIASELRRAVPRARAEFRVSNSGTEAALIDASTLRERLLGMLALFFGVVALLLAGVGLYGVLDYSVVQRRREIGVRIAIGARAGHIARGVAAGMLAMVAGGAVAGAVVGVASTRYIESLLFEIRGTDASALALPLATIAAVTLAAALPAVIRAMRIDPAAMLRSE